MKRDDTDNIYQDVIQNMQDEITKLKSELDRNTEELYKLKAQSQIWNNPFSIYNKEIIFVNQIHSSKIFFFDNICPNDIKADGIITKNKNVLLGILTADCAPIILLGNEYFGILHVGWRGLLSNIILKAVNLFIKRGEKKENIKFFIGPHLKFKSFEVQSDFIENIKQLKNFSIYLKENQNKIFFN